MFARSRSLKSTLRRPLETSILSTSKLPSNAGGEAVDPSCNSTITLTCLRQLYGAVGYNTSAKNGNRIAVTGYLNEFANIADLQLFFAGQNPAAVNSTFSVFSVNGPTHFSNSP